MLIGKIIQVKPVYPEIVFISFKMQSEVLLPQSWGSPLQPLSHQNSISVLKTNYGLLQIFSQRLVPSKHLLPDVVGLAFDLVPAEVHVSCLVRATSS